MTLSFLTIALTSMRNASVVKILQAEHKLITTVLGFAFIHTPKFFSGNVGEEVSTGRKLEEYIARKQSIFWSKSKWAELTEIRPSPRRPICG